MEKAAKPQRCWSQIHTPIAPGPDDLDPPPFTESELAVAQQLIHLSESSGPSANSANSMGSGSASSSTRSVNIPAWTPLEDVVMDDDGLWRRTKRYRPIADVYASTVRIDDEGIDKNESRKRKG